nr:SpaA isopeptide-forming pilin-related protein [uncultured Draconibacterium sp.]
MTKINFIAFLAFVISLLSCTTEEYVDPAPQLFFTVVEDDLIFVEGATVSLFNNQEDWENDSNVVASLQTDAKGQALFENLDEQTYYFYVEKGDLNNLADIAALSAPLQIGRKSELFVKIMDTQLQR